MNHPILRINAVHKLPANPPTVTATKTRIAPLSVAFAALLCLLGFASATNPASAQAINFGSINVCPAGKTTPSPCSANETVTFSIPADTTISSIPILTTGIADLDFKAKADDTSPTLCKAQTYSSATTCTVDVTFTPLAPGARNGAVELLAGSGDVIATAYIYGTGVGPQIVFPPAAAHPITASITTPIDDLVVDANGNIFANLYLEGSFVGIAEFLAADGYSTMKPLYSGSCESIALDGAGNIFARPNNGFLIELVAAQGYAVKTLNNVQNNGYVAVDGSGNLFVSDGDGASDPDSVQEYFAATQYQTSRGIGSGINQPLGFAFDAAQNLFLTDFGTNDERTIKEVLAAGGYTTVKSLTKANSANPVQLLGVDAADNVYFISYSNSALQFGVSEVVATGGYIDVDTLDLAGNISLANGTLDASGNIYLVTGDNDNPIYELPRSQSPGLVFAATQLDGASSPHSTTLQNIGNSTLTGSLSLTDSTDFSLVAGSGTPADCTASFSLVINAQCDISIESTPQSTGPLSGKVVLTDNAVSATGTSQSIALTGYGTTLQVSPTSLDFGSIPNLSTTTRTLTISNTGTKTLAVNPSSNGRSVGIAQNNCVNGVPAGGSCTLQVEFKPVELGLHTDTLAIETSALSIHTRGTSDGVGSLTTSYGLGVVPMNENFELEISVYNFGVPGNIKVAAETGSRSFQVYENFCTEGVRSGDAPCPVILNFRADRLGPVTAYLKLIPSVGPEQIIVLTADVK